MLASSVCWSLQCLISALTQGARWWSLFFRLACSVGLWGGRNTANKYHWRVFTVIQPHWVCPHSQCVCFPSLHCSDSRLLFRELSDAGPALHALPRSKLLRFRFSGTPQRRRLVWAYVFHPCPVQAAQVTRSLEHVVAPSWRLWLIPSPVPATRFSRHTTGAPALFWEADLWLQPSRQM